MNSLVRYTGLLAGLTLALLLTTATLGPTAQTATRTGTVSGDKMTLDLKTNQFVFTGNCKLTIAGPYNATLTSQKMIFKLSPGADAIEQLTTEGATNLSLITEANQDGQQYKIVASASQGATYSRKDEKVVLSGGAEADIISLPEEPTSQRAHFVGDSITANLKTSIIEVDKAHLQVETSLESQSQ